MKIGIDCRLWDETGVGRYIRNLVYNLQKIDKKNDYVLFALSKDYDQFKIQNSKFKIVRADIKWHTLEEQLKLPQILNNESLDLMHFTYFSVPLFYNRPFVVTIHDLIINHFPTGLASTLPSPIYNLKLLGYKFVIAQAAKKAKKIITVSNSTKEEIVDHLGVDSDKVIVTYEGVDSTIRNSKFPTTLSLRGAGKTQNYFLYVGNVYPHKNMERLLEAFNILISQYPNISLVCVGKEDYFYKRLKRKVEEMKLSDKVFFLQNISDEELSGLYQNTLALVLPSLMEGFGLTALEAMANKCLVLAADIPALKEICGDAAIYFDTYSIGDMKKRMEEMLNDSNHLTENIEKGLERIKLFSWQKMAKETLRIYESSSSASRRCPEGCSE